MTLKENKKKLKIAVQMDSLDKINKDTDSTLSIIKEAYKRKYEVFIYNVDELTIEKNNPTARVKKLINIDFNKKQFLSLGRNIDKKLKSFDVILIRQDPPFNMKYITSTYILEKISSSCLILNNPQSIRDCPEKLFVMDFSHLMPPTLVSRDVIKINSFIKKHDQVVAKPLYGNGGSDVYFLSERDPNLKIVIDNLLLKNEHIIVQKFLKKVKMGDKRVLLINGTPVGAVNRIPQKNEIRANLHIGGIPRKTNLNKRDIYICNQIKEEIKKRGLFFSGIDIIDGYLTEINVTSPTCIREIDALNNSNISSLFWDEVLNII